MLHKRERTTPLSREETKVAHRRRIVRLRYAHARTDQPAQGGYLHERFNCYETRHHGSSNRPCLPWRRPSHGRLDSHAEPCPQAEDGESAAKYLFKLSHDVILSLDRIGNILCINQRGVQLSGYSETELRGANIFELLLLPEDRQVAREMLADASERQSAGI